MRTLIPVGTYEVKLQWKSTGGTCRLGDRTMAVSEGPVSTQRTAASVPSSAKVLNKAGVWTDLPTSTVLNAVDPVSTLSITFSGEVTSNKGRLFLRALVDGEAASPADVTLIEGARNGGPLRTLSSSRIFRRAGTRSAFKPWWTPPPKRKSGAARFASCGSAGRARISCSPSSAWRHWCEPIACW